MIRGCFFIRKKIVTEGEQKIYEQLYQTPCRGLPQVPLLPEKNAMGSPKWRLFERCYEGSLVNLISQNTFLPFEQFIDIAKQLLDGLSALHHKGIAHGDIKLENAFFFYEGERLIVALGDLGFVSHRHFDICFSPFTTPPEVLKARQDYAQRQTLPAQDGIQLRRRKSRDIWSLGILFVFLLGGQKNPPIRMQDGLLFLPPLRCFINRLQRRGDELVDEGLINLSQEELDCSLKELKERYTQRFKQSHQTEIIWSMITQMLRIHPDERISALHALEELTAIGKSAFSSYRR